MVCLLQLWSFQLHPLCLVFRVIVFSMTFHDFPLQWFFLSTPASDQSMCSSYVRLLTLLSPNSDFISGMPMPLNQLNIYIPYKYSSQNDMPHSFLYRGFASTLEHLKSMLVVPSGTLSAIVTTQHHIVCKTLF